jgi:heme exporter protein D
MYTFALAVAGAFVLTAWPAFKSVFIVAAGGIAGAIPVWLAQWAWVGHPMGISVGAIFFGYGKAISAPVSAASATTAAITITQQSWRFTKVGNFLLDIQPQDWLATLAAGLILTGAIVLVLSIRSQPRHLQPLLLAALLSLLAGYSIWFHYSLYTWLKGILPTFPLFALALIYPNIRGRWFFKQQAYKFVALTALFFLALMFIFWPAFGGFQWGSRYLLPVYPLLVYMAWHAFATYEQFLGETNRKAQLVWRAVAISLLLISVLLQFSGIRTLRLHHQQLAEVQTVISNLPAEIILTNHYMLGSVMAPLEDKQFFYVTTEEDVEKLARRFAAGGIKQIAIIPGTYFIPDHPPLEIPDRVGDIILQEVEPLIYELR